MPDLVLGPMLRYVDDTAATIWVETSHPCEVELRGSGAIDGAKARTFEVRGQHYALVVAEGLSPGTEYEYQLALDGAVCWPEPARPGRAVGAFPPSAFVTTSVSRPPRIVFGSCRNSSVAETTAFGADALAGLAAGLAVTQPDQRPDAALLIGDQVYGDEVSPAIAGFIASRRDISLPPGPQACDFAEYSALYREAWSVPAVRWLLSVLPTVMIFDDHDVHDDWNTSAAWRSDVRARPWWRDRLTGACAAYWVYQHLGNLSPAQLEADETWLAVQRASGDVGDILADLAVRSDQRDPGVRWSVRRDFGGVRVVMIDSRSRRMVEDNANRRMVDETGWSWVTESVTGDFDHVVLATSVPLLLPTGIHALEAWSEAVCAGAWGARFARFAEKLRQAVDLEHWASFGASFADFERLLTGLAAGEFGTPPATVTVISGDVHHNYLAPVSLPERPAAGPETTGAGTADAGTAGLGMADSGTRPMMVPPLDAGTTAVWHAVCSPMRNVMPKKLRRAHALATSAVGTLAARTAARLAGARRPEIRWRVTNGPWFANMLATLDFDGRAARVRFDRSGAPERPALLPVHETDLTATRP